MTGKSGYIELSPSVLWASVRVYYEEDYHVDTNTSDLKITSIQVKSTSYQNVDYYIDGAITVDGRKVLALNSAAGDACVTVVGRNVWCNVRKATEITPITGELTGIEHDNGGKKTVEIALTGNRFQRFAFFTADGENGSGWGVKDAREISLTDIPRASPIAATDAAVGAVSSVTVTRRNAAYSHSVAFSFGELSGWLDADGSILQEEKKLTAATIPFRIPESFYGQLADAPYGSCRLLCTTYSGDEQIGNVQETSFRVTAQADACGPVVTGSIRDVNPVTVALTGDDTKLIRYASNALCTVTAEGREGATITEKTIGGIPVEDSLLLEKAETDTYIFGATDSRGYSSAVAVRAELIPYVPLTLHVTAKRTDPTGGQVLLNLKGNCFSGSFGAQENALTLSYTVGSQSGQAEAAVDGDSYTASIILTDLDYRSSHTVAVTAMDRITTVSATAVVGKGIPVFDWGENDFAFHVPVALEMGATVGGKTLLDLIYPVGSVYLSLTDTNPSDLFGGVWEAAENPLGLRMWQRTT